MAAKKNKINNIPALYVLPSDNKELLQFSKKFKLNMMEQIVSIIEFAVTHNLPFIEVFQFKNSDFVITLNESNYVSNLDNIFSYYMEKEEYENCSKVVKLQKTIKEKSVKIHNEK